LSLAWSAPTARREALRGHLAMLAFSAAVAGSFSLGAMVANLIAPSALNAMRFVLAASLLAGAAVATGALHRPGARAATALAGQWRYILLAALFAAYFVLMFEGLKTADPVSAGAVFTLTPLMTALLAVPLLGQRLRLDVGLALAVGAAGAVWVIFRGDPARLLAMELGRGEAVYFLGCVLHAVFTPLLKRFNQGEPALVATMLVMGWGAVLLLALGARALLAVDWAALPALVWVTLGYLAVFASAVTFVLLQFAAQRLPSSKVMAYTYLTPGWVILWEIGLGHGAPGYVVLPGLALISAALVLLLRRD